MKTLVKIICNKAEFRKLMKAMKQGPFVNPGEFGLPSDVKIYSVHMEMIGVVRFKLTVHYEEISCKRVS
jgi:hypothetical protein